MLRRLGRSALWGVGLGLAGWILAAVVILLDSIVPWPYAVGAMLIVFGIEFATGFMPLFSEEARESQRERARREALAELDERLTQG